MNYLDVPKLLPYGVMAGEFFECNPAVQDI